MNCYDIECADCGHDRHSCTCAPHCPIDGCPASHHRGGSDCDQCEGCVNEHADEEAMALWT